MAKYKFQTDYEKQLEYQKKRNMPLLRKKVAQFNKIKGVRVGDWIKDKYTGDISRVTYIWRDEEKSLKQSH